MAFARSLIGIESPFATSHARFARLMRVSDSLARSIRQKGTNLFIQHFASHATDSRESTPRVLLDPTHSLARMLCVLVASLLALALPGVARAQGNCEPQWNSYGHAPGTDGTVFASTMWDPDGAGPQPSQLVLGGSFLTAGGVPLTNVNPGRGLLVNRLTRWDGDRWSAFGSGMNGDVRVLKVLPNGDLVAGGSFTNAGGVEASGIARWNGTTWSALGAGVAGTVHALTLDQNGDLIVGGEFASAGGITANNVARWNGTTWSAFVNPLYGQGLNGSVLTLITLPSGEIVAGGMFNGTMETGGLRKIARWIGTRWFPLGTGMSGAGTATSVRALATLPNGDLIAGGIFTEADDSPANAIARWNGSAWVQMGTGLTGVTQPSVDVLAILPSGDLIIGGSFTRAGGFAANNIVRWSASSWSELGSGVRNFSSFSAPARVHTITTLPTGELFASGNFYTAGEVISNNTARWNGTAWSVIASGINGTVRAVCVKPDGDLLVGGDFLTAGSSTANRIAKWSPSGWSVLGTGMNNSVRALANMPSGDVYAGGLFSTADGIPANRMARWNNTAWSQVGQTLFSPGGGIIRASTILPNGDLIVAGSFSSMGGVEAINIARWNGTVWSALGAGIGIPFSQDVYALITLPNGDVIAGGNFTTAGGIPANRIARWNGTTWSTLGSGWSSSVFALTTLPNGDIIAGGSYATTSGVIVNPIGRWNGTTWSALGSGMNFSVFSLTTLPNGDIVAGGEFTTAGGVPANRIARWNGATWSALVSGVNGRVNTLTFLPNGDIIAGGDFTAAGGIPANRIARWNGTTWSALGSGMSSSVRALTTLPNGDIVAGGDFTTAGGIPANRIARWNGTTWSTLDSGMSNSVNALTTLPDGDVVAGGSFSTAGAIPAYGIARFDPTSSWSAIGVGTTSLNITISALVTLPDGDIIAGGDFRQAGSTELNRIARWDGSGWAAIGSGMSNGSSSFFAAVYALTTLPNGDIVAGGDFTTAGGVPANRIARWNGTAWSALGSGLDGAVVALTTLPSGDIVAAGEFLTAGGVPANRVARWNGTTWSPLGSGISAGVYALTTLLNGDIVAGGGFATAGGITVNGIARWNGTAWSQFGSGQNVTVTALALFPNGDLVVCGSFTQVGGVLSPGIARWGIPAGCSTCDSIDFNNNSLFPEDQDLVDFLAVLAGGACSNDPNCNDIDFNNDGLFPDDTDLVSFLTVLAGGDC